MQTRKFIFVSAISVLLMSVQVFGQATAVKKEQTQPKQVQKSGQATKKDSTKAETAAKQKATVPSKKYNKYKSQKKKDVPEIPLTNARITFEQTVFDFGMVPPGSKATYNFPVKNTGPDTLNITKIKAG